jgi:hypothetical protein
VQDRVLGFLSQCGRRTGEGVGGKEAQRQPVWVLYFIHLWAMGAGGWSPHTSTDDPAPCNPQRATESGPAHLHQNQQPRPPQVQQGAGANRVLCGERATDCAAGRQMLVGASGRCALISDKSYTFRSVKFRFLINPWCLEEHPSYPTPADPTSSSSAAARCTSSSRWRAAMQPGPPRSPQSCRPCWGR